MHFYCHYINSEASNFLQFLWSRINERMNERTTEWRSEGMYEWKNERKIKSESSQHCISYTLRVFVGRAPSIHAVPTSQVFLYWLDATESTVRDFCHLQRRPISLFKLYFLIDHYRIAFQLARSLNRNFRKVNVRTTLCKFAIGDWPKHFVYSLTCLDNRYDNNVSIVINWMTNETSTRR